MKFKLITVNFNLCFSMLLFNSCVPERKKRKISFKLFSFHIASTKISISNNQHIVFPLPKNIIHLECKKERLAVPLASFLFFFFFFFWLIIIQLPLLHEIAYILMTKTFANKSTIHLRIMAIGESIIVLNPSLTELSNGVTGEGQRGGGQSLFDRKLVTCSTSCINRI